MRNNERRYHKIMKDSSLQALKTSIVQYKEEMIINQGLSIDISAKSADNLEPARARVRKL